MKAVSLLVYSRFRWGVVLLAVVVLLVSFFPAVAQVKRTLAIEPSSGPAGSKTKVSGQGWTPYPNGKPYEIHWSKQTGKLLGEFEPDSSGAFSKKITIPEKATTGAHEIWVCQRCDSPKAEWQIVSFKVIAPPTPIPPSPTPTEVPTACDPTGAPGEVIIDFERFAVGENLLGVTLPEGVEFLGDNDLLVIEPQVETHSGEKALSIGLMMEFGSWGQPVRIGFSNFQDFVGVFVGRNDLLSKEYSAPLTATFTACGLDNGGHRVVLGVDSVTIGRELTPIRECLSVEAPGIFEVILDYGPEMDPEVLDDLVVRGPEVPAPVPEDDLPPAVEITEPLSRSTLYEEEVELRASIEEDRALERTEVWLNGVFYTEVGPPRVAPSMYDLLLRIPASRFQRCENNIEVKAYDAAGNEGVDDVDITIMVGDLEIASAEPVQVVYGAPLVQGKGTAFRAKVNSTFRCPVNVELALELPEDQWEIRYVGIDLSGRPAGWEYPEIWGPVTIPGDVTDFEVMLPYVAQGQEPRTWDASTNPAGIIRGREVGGESRPDVRLAPRPKAHFVSFAIEIDPENAIVEQNEDNNRWSSPSYQVVSTRGFSFLAIPVLQDGRAPQAGDFNMKAQIEFLLATFPLADGKISWGQAYAEVIPCLDDPGQDCVWTITAEGDVLGTGARMARASGYDYAVNIWDGNAGNAVAGYTGGVNIGDGAARFVFAHEFNHSMTGMGDIYSLDCLSGWDEAYCEDRNGERVYCCQVDAWRKPDGFTGLNCEYDSAGEVVCEEQTKECAVSCDCSIYRRDNPSGGENVCQEKDDSGTYVLGDCNVLCCMSRCSGICPSGGQVYHHPDDRIRHPASEGFWVNRWVGVDSTSNYIMDISGGPSDPFWWMRLHNTMDHCRGTSFQDGYLNLLRNGNFVTGEDPEAILVSGRIHKSGQVTLDPFIYLPEARLDLGPGSEGGYYVVLYDKAGDVLSRTGFRVNFFKTDPDGGPIDEVPFVYRIEWKEGTRRIVLQDGQGEQLASREVSEHRPEVQLIHPNGGEVWTIGKSYAVRWKATDEDGDAMSYLLDISQDAGETWLPIGIDLVGTEYELDTSGLEEGESYLVRVRATDGVNTGEDNSDAVFTVGYEEQAPILPNWVIPAAIASILGIGLIAATLIIVRKRSTSRRG